MFTSLIFKVYYSYLFFNISEDDKALLVTFTKRRETKLEHFVSNDAQENADLNDPRWDELKNLKTNEERMKYAMKAFGNKEPGTRL